MLRLLLLLFVASFAVCEAINLASCDRSLCTCPVPNGELGDAVMAKDSNDAACVCACGREEGAECTSDDHCCKGTSCSLKKDLGQGDGLTCINKCSTTRCPQYHSCVLVDSEPVCQCSTYSCSPLVASPVVATRDNEMKTYGNECERVDENCKQSMYNKNYVSWTV